MNSEAIPTRTTSPYIVALARALAVPAPWLWRWAIRRSLLKNPPGPLWRHRVTGEIVSGLFHDRGLRVVVDGIELCVHPCAAEYYNRNFEPLTRAAFRRLIPKSGVVVDVGSNAGFYTLAASTALAERGHVHAVEPSPWNQRVFRQNLRQARNVTLHPIAAGAASATLPFQISSDSLNDGFAVRPSARAISTASVRVEPLDDLISPPVKLIKMDIQGNEPAALLGMKRLIANSPGVSMIVEWDPACLRATGFDPLSLPALLESHGIVLEEAINDIAGTTEPVEDVLAFVRKYPETTHYWDLVGRRRD